MLFVILFYLIKTILYYVSRVLRHSQPDLFSVYCDCESTWDITPVVLLLCNILYSKRFITYQWS